MSELTKRSGIDRLGIKRITDFESARQWLDKFAVLYERNYEEQRNIVQGSTAAETPNWFIREATATDVTNGVATAAGNLIVEHKTEGTKHEFEK